MTSMRFKDFFDDKYKVLEYDDEVLNLMVIVNNKVIENKKYHYSDFQSIYDFQDFTEDTISELMETMALDNVDNFI